MAFTQTFVFEVDGVKQATTDVNSLSDAMDNLNLATEDLGKTSAKVAESLDEVTAVERAESIKTVVDGLAGGITSVAASLRGLGIEAEALNVLEQRANEFVAALDGAVRVVQVFDKNNVKAFKAAIAGFRNSGIAAKLFSLTSRRAIAATGFGILIVALGTLVANFDLIVAAVGRFGRRISGLKKNFNAALAVAKNFFSSLGEAFVKLLKGDLQGVKNVFKDIGAESSEIFNKELEKGQIKGRGDRRKFQIKQLEDEIKQNTKLLAVAESKGQNTLKLERAIAEARLSIAKKKFADEEEIFKLELARNKIKAKQDAAAAAAAKARRDKATAERKKAEAEQKAEDDKKAADELDRKERNEAALFELEQLRIQNEIDAIDAQTVQTVESIQERFELLKELKQNENERELIEQDLTFEETALKLAEFNTGLVNLEREKNAELAKLEEERTEKEKTEREKRLQNQKEADEEESENRQQTQTELQELQEIRNNIAAVNRSNLTESLELVKTVFGEESKAAKAALIVQKGLAISDIAIKLQQELQANAAAASANPLNAFSFGSAGAAQLSLSSALSIARATLATASVVKQKLAKGGIVRGASHSMGGVRGTGRFNNVEVEGGEFVVNKSATSKFLPQLKKINSFQTGGQLVNFDVVNQAASVADNTTAAIVDALDQVAGREVVVSVEEINRVNTNLVKIKERATI